ncbi:Zinc/iron permease [Amylocystis lapponica]|nr:Zinc/iron permease [Amylocystis lapponica]
MTILPVAASSVLKTLQKTAAFHATDDPETGQTAIQARLWLMLIIFLVSLFAVSFPTLARRTPGLRVPPVLFFIGRHFGTGVILSTAFAHLLQDAFAALQSPQVRERWKVGQWAGLIVLASLLSIFLVEYISTAFVDRLHSYSSAPPSPLASPSRSPSPSPSHPSLLSHPSPKHISTSDSSHTPPHSIVSPTLSQPQIQTPLPSDSETELPPSIVIHRPSDELTPLAAPPRARPTYGSTSHHHAQTFPRASDGAHTHNGGAGGEAFFAGGHHRHETRREHATHHDDSLGGKGWRAWFRTAGGDAAEADGAAKAEEGARKGKGTRGRAESEDECADAHEHEHEHRRRRRGQGHGHVHLDIESWHAEESGESAGEEGEVGGVDPKVGRRRQVVGILMLQIGIMLHSLVIGLTLAITSGPEFTSLVAAIIFHQLFEGLSLGIRIASLPAAYDQDSPSSALKPTLALSFALTTPAGIALGLGVFGPGRSEGAKLLLIQGLMSALSAGMLIYAACVEMLAGDFIMDPRLWRASLARQAFALGSLVAGVVAMAAVGIVD